MIISLYIDDLIIAGPKLDSIQNFKKVFGKRFKIKDLGEIRKVLGIRVRRDRANRVIYLDQTIYINQFLQEYRMREV